jgi:acyl-CoA hydrolase
VETHHLVLPGDLNQFGSLFGGRLLAWVDEAAWIAASVEFPHCHFVTIAMDKVEFRRGVGDGTSVTYEVSVIGAKSSPEALIFQTKVTFVSVNEKGVKQEI